MDLGEPGQASSVLRQVNMPCRKEKETFDASDMYAHGMCACAVVLVLCRCMITECAVVQQQLQVFVCLIGLPIPLPA